MESKLLKVVRALNLSEDRTGELRRIPESDWADLLKLTDRSHLTLPLGERAMPHLPSWVRDRVSQNLVNNSLRHERIAEAYERVAHTLSAQGIDFAVLKGFSHVPLYCDELHARPQYDLDFYCPPEMIQRAYDAIIGLGYEPFGARSATLDHLPPLILKTGWRPREDDYFDPDMPITIELHFRFWDSATERFHVPGGDAFWARREFRDVDSLTGVPMLESGDGLSYAAWHLIRHLLRGDARAYHVYEIAHFLHRTAAYNDFWRGWSDAKKPALLESIAFRLARDWFGCQMNPMAERLIDALPVRIQRWFELFGFSPLTTLERPNKDELFLHVCLVESWPDRVAITKRRLFPHRPPRYVADAHVAEPDWRLLLKRKAVSAAFTAKRALLHARTFLPVMQSGFRWYRFKSQLDGTST
jgi:hypothetical protein